jgi:hypothetical protein
MTNTLTNISRILRHFGQRILYGFVLSNLKHPRDPQYVDGIIWGAILLMNLIMNRIIIMNKIDNYVIIYYL